MALRRFRDHDRRGSASTLVILGLANPGSEYEGSRHNVGGDAVRLVAERRGVSLKHEGRQRALSATLPTERGPVTLAVPTTFMNESGAALQPLLRRTSLDDYSRLVVAHDELDLEPGRLQLKFGGGLAGHNGLRSIAKTLGTNDFSRLRIGIGKPPTKEQGADYVLQRPTGARKAAMAEYVAEAADALETLLDYEFEEAQQRINRS
ncbi:MAG TPA: aminoacyl-tRNA hydrolase [Acidimicrobiales bacterium]|nr:aminoacyl-tRNA hydrolase [Acidimicrobiales bacterium]